MFLQKTTYLCTWNHIFAKNEEKAMWRIGILLLFLLPGLTSRAQQLSEIDMIMRLKGVDSPEDADPYEVERLEELIRKPLRINHASLSRLEEDGILSHYQAVSLMDYRSRHGDVLSYTELSAVDGFGSAFVQMISPFISLESGSMPGTAASDSKAGHEIMLRAASKTTFAGGAPDGHDYSYAVRYSLSNAGQYAAGVAFAKSYDAAGLVPQTLCGYLRRDFKFSRGKLMAGDFNARFGQGLALWNGMSVGSMASPAAFLKRSSGLSPSSSCSGVYAFRGLAADLDLGRFRISSFVAMDGLEDGLSLLPAANVSYFGRYGQVGMTHYAEFALTSDRTYIPDMKTSADISLCLAGTDLFAECAYDWAANTIAALAGAVFPTGEDMRMAAMLRYYPPGYSPLRSAAARSTTRCSNEHALSISGEASMGKWVSLRGKDSFGSSVRRASCQFSLDAACFPDPKEGDDPCDLQLKANTEWTVMLAEVFRLKLKASERVRTWGKPFRTEVRADMSYICDPWTLTLRLNMTDCDGTGFLTYIEGGYKTQKCAIYMRQGVFCIDEWDDRIYAYERDAPGSFSVPAYYGRGVWTALTGSWRFARWGRMYARAAFLGYPFMEKKKPGKAELKLQFIFDI